ncbi:cytochrome c/c1 heme-lyase [Gorgonomyces haynaldii]|nr:cytochrome c/c1 heme-lyase [Gorgonomyces haynaldii]
MSSEGCPVDHMKQADSCPYDRVSELNNMPAPNQKPHPLQTEQLSVEREQSTIPTQDGKVWIYPSEQMFYNAMKRKNWDAKEKDMSVIVPIHNAVNEQTWKKILDWEREAHPNCQPKLVKFQGKPKEYTIKARLRQLMGYTLPFDRHDWIVRSCEAETRYIIDYYSGPNMSFYLDVRPAPTASGLFERAKRFLKTFEF